MADLTAPQLKWLRDTVGTEPDDAALQGRFDVLGSVRDVGIAVLRDRRANLLATSLQVSVAGVASINNTENVKALEREIAALAKLDDDPTDEPGEDVSGTGGRFEVFNLTRSRGR